MTVFRFLIFFRYALFVSFNLLILNLLYHIIDYFFLVFHSALILFNVFGWIWKKTQRWNLATLLLTGGSWVILGVFYVFGYCPLTDWHFKILRKLGEHDLPGSYIKYLTDRIFQTDSNPEVVDNITLYAYLALLVASIYANFFRGKRFNGAGLA